MTAIPDRNASPSFGNAASLDAIFNPKKIAVVAQSSEPGTVAHKTLSSLLSGDFHGSTFLVQPPPSADSPILSYPTLDAIPEKIDLVIAATSSDAAPAILRQCVRKDVRGVAFLASDFGPYVNDDAGAAQHMREILQGSRTRVLGPGSLGVMNPLLGLNATPGLQMPIGGTVAFLSESATVGRLVLDWSLKHIVGFSVFATLGTMLDISWSDLIDYFGRHPSTRTIVIEISSVSDARSFMSAAREVSLNKPIIVIKAGRSDNALRAVGWKSHSVPSDDDVLTAAFHRVGVLQVDTLEDLFYTADALSKQPRPQGPRLMVVSNADGPGVLAADCIVRSGVELAEPTPVTCERIAQMAPREDRLDDLVGDGSPESYASMVEISSADTNCDGLLLLMVPDATSDPQRTTELILQCKDRCAKPMLISYMGTAEMPAAQETLARTSIPTFSSPAAAARIFHYMWRYSYHLKNLYETPQLHSDYDGSAAQQLARDVIATVRKSGQVVLDASQKRRILAAYGLPTFEDGPSSPDLHNTYRAKLGCRIDPQFGPVLMFGSADRGPDVYGDCVTGLPPLNATLARRMLEQSRFYDALLRGVDPKSMAALEGLLVRFSELVSEQPWIKKLEVHLLLSSRRPLIIQQAYCELHGDQVGEDELPRPAIRPYPSHYVSSWTMKNGRSVVVRPIRAEDEPLMVKFHERLSDRSVYLRYFQRVKLRTRTAHERLSRVCFLDYDRELALLAEYRDPPSQERQVIAVATLAKVPPRNDGELAVLISDDFHGQGLGKELIARLVAVARDEGLRRVTATTMRENSGMCAVFEKLGFQLTTDFEDQLVRAELTLA